MNPHTAQKISPAALYASLWRNRQLVAQLMRRDVLGRYKGSLMGLAWSLFNPILMLAVYTFVFSVVFGARWGTAPPGVDESKAQFAVVLFVGLIVHGLLAEVLNRSPALVLNNVSYVKKVVFPIEILSVVTLGSAVFHSFVSIAVLLAAFAIFNGFVQWTAVFFPLVILPFLVLVLGLSWILASLGTYVRDVGQTIGVVTLVLMYLSPVFYPVAALPEALRPFVMANPLTLIVEQSRAVLLFGHPPDWQALGIYSLVAALVGWVGYAWFQKTRKGFADVL